MPSVVVEANTEPQTAFNVPSNKIGKITFIEVNNQSATDVTITVEDVFTPTPSTNNPNPSEVTKERKILTVKAGDDVSWEDYSESIEILGTCKVVASVTDPNCKITIGYKLE